MEFLKPSSKTGLLSSTQMYPRPLFTSHSFDHCSIQATLRGPCPLSLPFYILSEMRVVEKEEGGTKESEDIGPSRKKGNYRGYCYVSRKPQPLFL